MGKRREIREATVQLLYSKDLNPDKLPTAAESTLEDLWHLVGDAGARVRPVVRQAAESLASAVLSVHKELDDRIAACTSNYQISRIAAVDRNILRLALYEMFYREDVPPIVAINEAIEIAKRFGSEESGRFVNGVLDRAKLDLNRPLRTASAPSSKPHPSPLTPQHGHRIS